MSEYRHAMKCAEYFRRYGFFPEGKFCFWTPFRCGRNHVIAPNDKKTFYSHELGFWEEYPCRKDTEE